MILSKRLTLFLSIFLLCISCEKVNYYSDKPLPETKTLILAHRGGGNSGYQENTLQAVSYGFSVLDGVEVDVQLSKDRTIWLSHNAMLPTCNQVHAYCFASTYDQQIVNLDSCFRDAYDFSRLEDVFKLMSSSYSEKHISIDVKAWTPCDVSGLHVTGIMNVIADEISRLTIKYKLQNRVMVESETGTFLNYLKKHSSGIDCYLTTLGDFERGILIALEQGYAGISFKYKFDEEITPDHIQLLHKKGLKIQLWNINSKEDFLEAISLNPDFIQTDDMDNFITD